MNGRDSGSDWCVDAVTRDQAESTRDQNKEMGMDGECFKKRGRWDDTDQGEVK